MATVVPISQQVGEIVDVGSPQWWLVKLEWQLRSRQAGMLLKDRYYYGDHPLPFLTKAHEAKMANEFHKLLTDSRSNFMRLVVDATEERLRVDGFRLSGDSDEAKDKQAWDLWQANCLDASSQTAFVEALVKGVSYLSVWADTDGDGYADIAIEDPLQTIVGYAPGTNYRRRAAALKVWRDDWTGKDRANIYLPDGIYKFEAADPRAVTLQGVLTPAEQVVTTTSWSQREDEFVANDVGIVPIIPLRNRPRLLLEGESEIEDVIPIQNQINATLFLRQLALYFGAHKQRYATGMTLFEDENGRPVEPLNIASDRMITSENPDAKFGEFGQTDLSGYINSIEQQVQHIATTSRTPKHYLLPVGQEPSGDAIKSADAGLVKKVERKHRPFGEALEEAIRLARMFDGEKDAPMDSEIVWADPRIRTEAEITDATLKKFQAGLIPAEQALEDLGYTQTQIARMKTMDPSTIITSARATELVVDPEGLGDQTATAPEAVASAPGAAASAVKP